MPTFGRARDVFGKTEYEHWRDHSDEPNKKAVFADLVKPTVDAGKAELIASDAKLCDEITMIATPGHGPGHTSIFVQSESEPALLSGDVAHHPCQMAHLDWSSTADSDPVQSALTRRQLFARFADQPTLVIGGHFDAGHIRRDGDAFRFDAFKFISLASLDPRGGSASLCVSNHATPMPPVLRDAPCGGLLRMRAAAMRQTLPMGS